MTALRAARRFTSAATVAFAALAAGCASNPQLSGKFDLTGAIPAAGRTLLGMGNPSDVKAVVGSYQLAPTRGDDYTNGWKFPVIPTGPGSAEVWTEYDRKHPYTPKLHVRDFDIFQPITDTGADRIESCKKNPVAAIEARCVAQNTPPKYALYVLSGGIAGDSPYNGVIAVPLNCTVEKRIVTNTSTNVPHLVARCKPERTYDVQRKDGSFVPGRTFR